MANNSSSASHWCKDVIEESTKNNPLAAPGLPVPSATHGQPVPQYYQQQQSPYNTQQSGYQGYNAYSYYNPANTNQSTQYLTSSSSATATTATQQTQEDYYKQYYEQFRRYNQQSQSNLPSNSAANTSLSHPQTNVQQTVQHQPHKTGQHITYASAVQHGGTSAYTSNAPSAHRNILQQTPQVALNSYHPAPPPAVVAQAKATTLYVKKPSRFSKEPNEIESRPATDTKTSTTTQNKNSNFPPNLKSYVERAFASCKTDADRKFIEGYLKEVIGKVSDDGRLHKHRWDLESIPRLDQAHILPETAALTKDNDEPLIQYSVNGETRKRKSRFSMDTNKPSYKADYPSPSSSVQPIKKVKNLGAGIYGPASSTDNGLGMSNSGRSPRHGAGIYGPASLGDNEEVVSRKNRLSRFSNELDNSPSKKSAGKGKGRGKKKGKIIETAVIPTTTAPLTEEELENMKVVGTCHKLEKDYFRLTSAPDPSTVRPQHILRKSLAFVKKKWVDERFTNKEINSYVLSQFKSIRQDLTLQHISNDLTVEAYESHARVALEIGDLNEYNQCQTQLKQLYASGLKGSDKEFTAYRILYYLYLRGNKKYQSGSQDLLNLMASLSAETQSHPSVLHALSIRQAILQDNYHRFFTLYKRTPDLGNCILDLVATSYRFKVLQRMIKAYKPSIQCSFIISELGFDCESAGNEFLKSTGCLIVHGNENPSVDTKNTALVPPKDDSGLLL